MQEVCGLVRLLGAGCWAAALTVDLRSSSDALIGWDSSGRCASSACD